MKRWGWWLLGVTALAAVARGWTLLRFPLWTDEVYTFNSAGGTLVQALLVPDQTPPLFVALLHVWREIFGSSLLAVRTPSFLFGVATVPLAALAFRRFMDGRLALWAAALAALSVDLIIASQEARAYAAFVFFCTWSWLALLRLQERWSRANAAAYVAATALMLYSHVYGVFFALGQTAFLAATVGRDWRRWLALQALAGALFVPWLPSLLSATHRVLGDFWIQPLARSDLRLTWHDLTGGGPLAILLPALALAALLLWLPRLRAGNDRRVLALWAWFAVPVAVPMLVSLRFPIYWVAYIVPAVVPLLGLCAWALQQVSDPAWRTGCAAVGLVAAVAVAGSFFVSGQGADNKQDWWSAFGVLDGQAAPNATVVFNTGLCDAVEEHLACPYHLYGHRPDLRLVGFLVEDRGVAPAVNTTNIVGLDARVAQAPQAWVVYTYDRDPHRLIPARLQALGFHPAGDWKFKRVELLRFDR